jgi:acyl dehydratase
MKFFEDIALGERAELGAHTFSADDIKRFARKYDPQPFHLDEAAAARSHFGALCASGWHTASVWMRLMVDHQRSEDEARRGRGEAVASLGPSPGFRELKWLKPVYAGDTVTYSTEIVDKRASNSRPGWGLMSIRNTGVNQKGEPVISFISVAFIERRPAKGAAKSAPKSAL